MFRIRSTALPAAVFLTLTMGACQDAFVAPRAPSLPSGGDAPKALPPGVRTFSGRTADSVMRQLLGAWARIGHPEYLADYQARREKSLAALLTGKAPGGVNREFVDGDDPYAEPYKDPPTIISHIEQIYFGHDGDGINTPTGVNAKLTFVGDQARIDLSSVTISGKGNSVSASGVPLASGGGAITNCNDIGYDRYCQSQKTLDGVVLLATAATCDATGQASLNYTSFNVSSTASNMYGGGTIQGMAVASATTNAVSPPCDTQTKDDGNQTGDTGGGGGAGGGDTWPQPTGPIAIPEPWYPNVPGPAVDFHCETNEWWSGGRLDLTRTSCYGDN
jgi:hypothetical protein